MTIKYAHLLKDRDVKRWYDNLKAKSAVTADVFIRGLGLYCELNQTTPKAILKEARRKRFRDKFTDFVRGLEKKGKAGSYISRFKKVLHSWLAYNNVNVRLKVNITGEYDTPTLAFERVPLREELDKILRMATPRGRVSISLMSFCGLRPESIGNDNGSDGLRIGDLIEAEIDSEGIEFENTPTMVVVRKNLSKARHQYFTFLPEQGMTLVREYVEKRIKQGERLDQDTPLLGFDTRGHAKNNFLRTNLVTRDVKEAIVKAGYKWRPYVLRSYCDTNMIIAESKGKISHPYLQFFMGHKGDIEATYSTKKYRLPPDMVKEMRESYKRCQDFLQTTKGEIGEDKIREAFKKELLALAGFSDEEITKQDLSKMTDEQLHNIVRQRLLGVMANNGNRQRVVPLAQVEKYVSEGWEYVAALPNEQAVVKMPF